MRQEREEARHAIARGARSGQRMMIGLMRRLADAERRLTPKAGVAKRMRTGRVVAMIDMRRRARQGFSEATAAAPSASDDAFSDGMAGGGDEGASTSRKRAWEARGVGADWMLERDAELAARHERLCCAVSKRPRCRLRASCDEREAGACSAGLDS